MNELHYRYSESQYNYMFLSKSFELVTVSSYLFHITSTVQMCLEFDY